MNPVSAQETAPTSTVTSSVVEDGGTGPFKAIMVSEGSLPTHTVFKPSDLSAATKKSKLPVIVWGNGACANSPWEHINFLSEVASHGFMAIAIGPMPKEGERTGDRSSSSQMTDAIDWAIAQNNDKASPYYGKLDIKEIAVSGMSCGGLQALETAPDPRISKFPSALLRAIAPLRETSTRLKYITQGSRSRKEFSTVSRHAHRFIKALNPWRSYLPLRFLPGVF